MHNGSWPLLERMSPLSGTGSSIAGALGARPGSRARCSTRAVSLTFSRGSSLKSRALGPHTRCLDQWCSRGAGPCGAGNDETDPVLVRSHIFLLQSFTALPPKETNCIPHPPPQILRFVNEEYYSRLHHWPRCSVHSPVSARPAERKRNLHRLRPARNDVHKFLP